MVVTVKCQSCGTSLKLREGFAKSLKEFKCLKCGSMIPLQGQADAASSPSPAPAAPSVPKPPMKPMAPLKPAAPATVAPAADAGGGTISMECSGCKRPMSLRSALAGKKIRCKECGAVSTVPESSPAVSAPKPAPAPAAPAPVQFSTPKSEPKTIVLPVEAATLTPAVEDKTFILPPSAAGLTDSPSDLTKALADRDERLAAREKALAEALLRADKAENALRSIAGHHAVEKADLQHRIEDLTAKLAAINGRPAVPPTLVADLDNLVVMQSESLKARVDEIKRALASGPA